MNLFRYTLAIPSADSVYSPSGFLTTLLIRQTVPTLYKSFSEGSSIFEFFCVTKTINLSEFQAKSNAALDLGLPEIIGTELPGKITVSRKGPTGMVGLSLTGVVILNLLISTIC